MNWSRDRDVLDAKKIHKRIQMFFFVFFVLYFSVFPPEMSFFFIAIFSFCALLRIMGTALLITVTTATGTYGCC